MPERKISFFLMLMPLQDLSPKKEVRERRHNSIFAGVKHGNKAAKGISLFYYSPANARRLFDTFLTAFHISVLKNKLLSLTTTKKIMLKGSGLVSGAAGAGASPSQRLRPERSVSPRAIANLCLGATLQKEQTFFFFPPTRCLKASPTLKAVLYPLSLFFEFGLLGFFIKPEFPAIWLRIFGSG